MTDSYKTAAWPPGLRSDHDSTTRRDRHRHRGSARIARLLPPTGLDIPADAESSPHVEVALPGGQRLLWDTEDVVRSFDPEWPGPKGGERLGLAFLCDSPAEVDAVYAELTAASTTGGT